MDVAYMIRRAARWYPDAPAVEDNVRGMTMRELVALAERLANRIDAMGVPPNGTIGVLMENRWEYILVDLAIALARRTRVAMNARLALDDFRFMSADAEVSVLFHTSAFAEEAEALHDELGLIPVNVDSGLQAELDLGDPTVVQREGTDEDPAWITYTSGTTGRPKGIVLSHRSISQVAINLLLELGPVAPGQVAVLTQPLSHGAGYFVLPWLIAGGGLYVVRRFDPEEVLAVGRRPEVDLLKIVPAMLPPLLQAAGSRPISFSSIVYGAAPIAPAVLELALDAFGPVLMQIYGQSEAPVTLTVLGKDDHLGDGEQRFSAGRPWRTVTTQVRDDSGRVVAPGEEGELFVTGPHVMNGYRGLPEATAAVMRDGWIKTNDMAREDDRGFIFLLGRRDEMINSGGFNISPREVERVLNEHPSVQEVVVFGVPDERWGQAVTAAVQAHAGHSPTADELSQFARPRLGFRTPKTISLLEGIPRNPYGKVDRRRLVEAVEAAEAAHRDRSLED